MRSWSVRHARGLNLVYEGVESLLLTLHPLLKWIGYERLDKPFLAVEKMTKGFLLDSQNCGQCVVGSTGLSCPMNCPELLRNGPCGGVRPNGKCEIESDMDCVWVLAWEGNQRMYAGEYPIQVVQPAVDNRLSGHSAWLRDVQNKVRSRSADESAANAI